MKRARNELDCCRSGADHIVQGNPADATPVPGGAARHPAEEAQSQDYQPM